MREGRRFVLGFLLLVSLVSLGLSNIPLINADAVEDSSGEAEAVVDATGDVQVEESQPEPSKEGTDRSDAAASAAAEAAAQEAMAEAAARQAEAAAAASKADAQAAAAKAEAEAAAAKAAADAVDEVEEAKVGFVDDVGASAKSKAMAFVNKAKEITPEKMKKVAAGALGVWGVAAGAGWVMNNLGGAEE